MRAAGAMTGSSICKLSALHSLAAAISTNKNMATEPEGKRVNLSQLIIRGAKIKELVVYMGSGGQRTVDIKMSAVWSKPVCEAMNWSFEPQGFENGGLEGKLMGVNLIMEPSDAALKDYRFDLGISEAGQFKLKSKKDGEGNIGNRELEFVVVSIAPDAITVLENWVSHLGDGLGQAKIVFNAEEQGELDMESAEEKTDEAPKSRGRRKATEEAAAVQ